MPKEQEHGDVTTPKVLFQRLRETVLARHDAHLAQVHRQLGGTIGLVNSRVSRRLRYAPSDHLIKALVAANVAQHMEFGAFLDILFQRYGLVIGEREAAQCLPINDADLEAFKENARRLELRLSSLGMMRKLSDSRAYVRNPYQKEEAMV